MTKFYLKKLMFATIVFFNLHNTLCYAQTEVKSYIPPSPNAMTFMKYGDYPVDYSTGIPNINIPLYNIDLKGFSFPISASFHASGRMASLNFSALGMNWALNASGMISREIKGKPDGLYSHPEQPASYYALQYQHRDELVALENPKKYNSAGTDTDPEYDIYSISVNGVSAKFIIRDNGNVVFLTYCPYTVTGSPASGFTVTDEKGSIYKFGTYTVRAREEAQHDGIADRSAREHQRHRRGALRRLLPQRHDGDAHPLAGRRADSRRR